MASILIRPFILSYALEYFASGTNATIKLPIRGTIIQILGITVISIGMLICRFKTNVARRMEKPLRSASNVIFTLVCIAVLAANFSNRSCNERSRTGYQAIKS